MTEKEFVEKNLKLSFEFSKYVLEHPEIEDSIPQGAQVVILLENDPEFNERNTMLAKEQHEEGQPVVFVKVKKLAPERFSRLLNLELEMAAAI